MYLRLLKAAPKWVIVFAVIVSSTGLFAGWWMLRTSQGPRQAVLNNGSVVALPTVTEEVQRKAAKLPEQLGWLALVGNDLYNIQTGELIFENWLGGIPQRLFYQKETNRLMAQTERGVIRFALDGSKDGMLGDPAAPPAFTHDGKQAQFIRNGDVWVADVDWRGFRFVNERQVTKLGQFNGAFFSQNVLMGTEKAILVKVQNQLVRVDLLTGAVEPQRIPLNDLNKRRSPNGRYLIGEDGKSVYVYDVEASTAKSFPKGRDRVNDWQWLSDTACGIILGAKAVAVYDGKQGNIRQVAGLSFACNRLVAPSPNGNYAICYGARGMLIVEFSTGKVIPFGTPVQDLNWIDEETLIYCRDVPNTNLRGTWLKTVTGKDRRAMSEPYLTGDDNASFALIHEASLILFATRTALFSMKFVSSECREVVKLAKPMLRIQAAETWGL